MNRRFLTPALAALCLAATAAAAAPATLSAQQIPVQAGVNVTPDTVRIGDPFRIIVGIRAPLGAKVDFPNPPDSTSPIQALDPVAIATTPDSSAVVQYATYRVAAWDVDSQRVHLDDVLITLDGRTRHVALPTQLVFVKTVLPADSAKRVPKPPRPIYESSTWPWWLWLLLAAAAALIIGLIWWWWRRKRRKPVLVALLDPYERAQEEFTRIESLGLLQAGERGRYVALMVEVLREYIAGRYAIAPLALTTGELVATLRGHPHMPVDRLAQLLADADLVKFARRPVSAERAAEFGRDARMLVQHEHEASQAAAAAEAAAAAAASHKAAA
jgi:hypothetical protein